MSVSNSSVSSRPTSTVVGGRNLKETILTKNSTHCTTKDESSKRGAFAWFERKLKIKKYLRDKENEERLEYEKFIRLNSKLLQCSYQIPAGDIYRFLKRLHTLLEPGFRAKHQDRSAEGDENAKNKEHDLKILHDWMTCSDLTVQTFPKSPTVLWFDLECMVCKSGKDNKRRHLRSKRVVETILRSVVEFTKRPDLADSNSDVLYVTRGTTCGMHLFFPYVTLYSENDVQDVWNDVNKRLEETDQTAAVVDTGCSAMPLPLSRNHNALTRVEVTRSGADGEHIAVTLHSMSNISVNDLARVSNFHHLVNKTQSPSSSVVSFSACTTTDSNFVKRKRDESPAEDATPLDEETATVPNVKRSKSIDDDEEDAGQTGPAAIVRAERVEHTADTNIPITEEEKNTGAAIAPNECFEGEGETGAAIAQKESVPSTSNAEQCFVEAFNSEDDELLLQSATGLFWPDREIETSNDTAVHVELDDDDERCSNTSASSKRLVQSDIRSICAKAQDRKRKRAFSEDSNDRHSAVESKTHPTKVSVVSNLSKALAVKENESGYRDDDAASSSLCMGRPPSVQTSQFLPNSLLTTEDEENNEFDRSSGPSGGPCDVHESEGLQQPSTSTAMNIESSILPDRNTGDQIPFDASIPDLFPSLADARHKPLSGNDVDIARKKEDFESSMKLRLENRQNPVHETDIQLITSIFNTEVDFYTSMMKDSVAIGGHGLRLKTGCSLNASRENCPSGLYEENVPHVLYAEDFVSEIEWLSVLIRYFDEYMNNAPFLYVMLHVLKKDKNVINTLNGVTRRKLQDCAQNCLLRLRNNAQAENEGNKVSVHPYDQKCTMVIGLIAICSQAFKIVTPVFTDLAKMCRLMLGTSQQTCETLNSSTMPTAGGGDSSYGPMLQDDPFLDDSVSQVGCNLEKDHNEGSVSSEGESARRVHEREGADAEASNNIGNDHSVLASILRWNYSALDYKTRWCLFFYYYHVLADGLTRIMNEVVHGGLMVTAVLQAYFESFANNGPVDIGLVCRQVYYLNNVLAPKGDKTKEDDGKLMPPPKVKAGGQRAKKSASKHGGRKTFLSDEYVVKKQRFEMRNHNSKEAQKRFQETRSGSREDYEDGDSSGTGMEEETEEPHNAYHTDFSEVLSLFVQRYLRPVSFDETTVIYTEAGYEQRQSEFSSSFTSCKKEMKNVVKDVFSRATLKYSMPHGDLSMYNTDLMSTVHRRSSLTNNLVLNIFEDMYGGCMTYLTRRYNQNLKIRNRFNANAYRLVVECRHAMKEFIQSIELSYLNLILRQPVVPAVLECDIGVRRMFMSEEEIMKGSFVCLNAMDYVRCINMFTKHSKFPQENCRIAESFLDQLITGRETRCDGDEEARSRFRTVFLFYLLYIFEVLYKIRHAYNRDRTYYVSVERLSWDLDIRSLLKLFFGPREFKMPQGLSDDALRQLDLPADLYSEYGASYVEDDFKTSEGNRALAARCINTRPTVSTAVATKEDRMFELFKKKGIVIMKSYAAKRSSGEDQPPENQTVQGKNIASATYAFEEEQEHSSDHSNQSVPSYEERDRAFLDMAQAKLEDVLYSRATWYENCRVRMKAVARMKEAENKIKDLEMCMDAVSMDTFLRTQLRVIIDNDRLNHIDQAVMENKNFAFCTHMPLRTKMMALVLATHSAKRMTSHVAAEFVRKEYHLERTGVVRFARRFQTMNGCQDTTEDSADATDKDRRPDQEWERAWNNLLSERRRLLLYIRSLADSCFPDSYFIGLHPDDSYNTLYNYMSAKKQYQVFHSVKDDVWAKDVCVAMNFLLVMNAYDTELVELCLRLFLSFEWPGQWAKRIFVWKSNSNAGKSFFFESIISKVFDHSTTINDPKGGKDNAPEKSEYYKNFLLMINEFTTASSCELKKLCSMSGYKFRMNFGNQMIQAYMVGKMVFNCNTLPLTTDHATIQRVALIPLPFWFNKRQSVMDALLNWTMGQSIANDYEKNFRRNVSRILTADERKFFIDNPETKNETDLFNEPEENTLKLFNRINGQKTGASMFLVQNKTSQVYLSSSPATGTIVSGIMLITRYFCRFRYFNKIKEPVDFSTIPSACVLASQEWERFSQPYYEWKERYRVEKDTSVRTKVSVIHASLSHFAKNYSKNTSFFDLRQFFEVDFVDNKIQYYNAHKEDEYNVRLDPLQD